MSNHSGNSTSGSGSTGGFAAAGGTGKSSITGNAAKVFREFKWGLLTLFLLMAVVIVLVYDGSKKPSDLAQPGIEDTAPAGLFGPALEIASPPVPTSPAVSAPEMIRPQTAPIGPVQQQPITPLALGQPQPAAPAVPATRAVPAAPAVPAQPITPPATAPATAATPPSAPAAAAVVAPPARTYVVKGGDTLSSIATQMVGGKNALSRLIAANRTAVPNPDRLRIGTILTIPSEEVPVRAAEVAPAAAQDREASGESLVSEITTGPADYVVQSGDTLERIAHRHFKDGRKWRDIFEWNRDKLSDPGRLRIGQVIRLKPPSEAAPPAGTGASLRAEVVVPPEEESGGIARILPASSAVILP